MNVYRYHIKCMACGLHYQVYSEYPEWEHRPETQAAPEQPRTRFTFGFCPECGSLCDKGKIVWREVLENTFIFEHVPGKAGTPEALTHVGVPQCPKSSARMAKEPPSPS
jgi:hypothetical protein